LLRPGRFDEIIEIPRPSRKMAEEILSIYLTDDLPIEAAIVKEQGGHKEALNHLKSSVMDEFYSESKWVKTKADPAAKEEIKTVKRKDIVSGAIIAAVVKTAKKNYVKRVLDMKKTEREKAGLNLNDFLQAIEEESKEHAITDVYLYEMRQREIFRSGGGDPMVG